MKKKLLWFSLLGLILLYSLWLSYHIIRFQTYTVPPSEPSSLEIEGTYHIHSTFSDGRKHPDEIARLAALASLDFIILTDHGNPNYKSLAIQGWKEGVLVLSGSELSVSRGHLVALDFEAPSFPFSQKAEMAVQEIKEAGGFTIIAHPYSKVNWTWGPMVGYAGLEVINADTMVKKNILRIIPFFPALPVKPEYVLLKILGCPRRNLRKWDELNALRPLYGYFSTDAHLLYQPLLRLLRLHLLLQAPLSSNFETAKRQVYDTLRKGRFYNSVHAAAHARGFRFWGKDGEKKIPMGSTVFIQSPVILQVKSPFPFHKEIHILYNGREILRSTKENIVHSATQPGTYRVEVYLKEKSPLSKKTPWIISNPIYLKRKKT